MPDAETIYNALSTLDSLPKLKALFAQLNYRVVGAALPTRGWDKSLANSVHSGSILAEQNDFRILYAQLTSLKRGVERPLVTQLLRDYPSALIIFSDIAQQNWHFVNVKYDDDATRRRLIRRMAIGKEERLHTAAERLDKFVRLPDTRQSALEIQSQHDKAFDVEAVSREFFEEFVDMFHLLRKDIAKRNNQTDEDAGRNAQMLLDRLLFLYFVQRKGWLNGDQDYLYNSFKELYRNDPKGASYYRFLIRLFLALSNEGIQFDEVGEVPFLNGGLFEVDMESKKLHHFEVGNAVLKDVFEGLLQRYNFTVREDTPLDVEVAIDPEMLGKVFEQLILSLEKDKDLRKTTGSYYTPRVIVYFMCHQALKEYLSTESGVSAENLDVLLQMNPADHQLMQDDLEILEKSVSKPQARHLHKLIEKAECVNRFETTRYRIY